MIEINWTTAFIDLPPREFDPAVAFWQAITRAGRSAARGDRAQFATLVIHYWANDCFLPPGGVLPGMPLIADIPGVLIHGRYDVSGPLSAAWELHKAWPASRLVVLTDSGHGGTSMSDELAAAIASLGP